MNCKYNDDNSCWWSSRAIIFYNLCFLLQILGIIINIVLAVSSKYHTLLHIIIIISVLLSLPITIYYIKKSGNIIKKREINLDNI